jgi:hypothetical protein
MSYPVHEVPAGDVLPIFFDTYDGGTGASITMSGLAVTDIEIYKDGSVTQRASDAGYTLLDTDGIDFDGITGIHGFSIDTGDNTDAGFYTVGSWFHVVVSAVTVDAQTVSFVVAAFRIMEAETTAGRPLTQTAALSANAITAAAISADAITDAKVAADVTIASVTGAVGSVTGNVGGNVVGSVGSVTAGVTLAASAVQAVWDALTTALTTAGSIGKRLSDFITGDAFVRLGAPAGASVSADIAAAKADTAATLVDTNELQTDWVNGGRLDLLIDAIKAKTDPLPTDPADASDIAAAIAALNDLSAAEVNAEVVDALATDTYAEPAGVPAATATLATKLGFLYEVLRNKLTVTSTKMTFFNDADAAQWEKDLADDLTTYSESEGNAP